MRRASLFLIAVAVVAWSAALFAAPAVTSGRTRGDTVLLGSAAFVYAAGSFVCHQRPERSFHMYGAQLPVCARCTGLYVGAAIGVLAWMVTAGIGRTLRARAGRFAQSLRPRLLLLVLGAPTILTVATAWLGWWDPGNVWRAALAIPLGVVVGAVVVAVAAGDLR